TVSVRTENAEANQLRVPPPHRVRRAALSAVSDVLGRFGADRRRVPDKYSGGSITTVKSICALVEQVRPAVSSGAVRYAMTPKQPSDGRIDGCRWQEKSMAGPDLEVRAYAYADPVASDRSAAEIAAAEVSEGRK